MSSAPVIAANWTVAIGTELLQRGRPEKLREHHRARGRAGKSGIDRHRAGLSIGRGEARSEADEDSQNVERRTADVEA